jgi:hypothetical protein
MKENCRKALAALVLVLAFSSAAFADDGIMWPSVTPPPPPPPATTAASAVGSVRTIGTASADGYIATDPLTETALTLIQIVLSLP